MKTVIVALGILCIAGCALEVKEKAEQQDSAKVEVVKIDSTVTIDKAAGFADSLKK